VSYIGKIRLQTVVKNSEEVGIELDARLITSDVLIGLESIEDESVKLVVTSPPYNIGKSYERDTKLTLEEYIEWLRPVISTIHKKLSADGSVCWQTGNFIRDGEVFPLDYFFYRLFTENGFKLRNRVIWRFNFGLHASKRLSGRYETLLWFTKTDDYTFNLDPIRVPQLYPGKRHSPSKGEAKAGKPSGNPKGKNPSDYWTFSAEDSFVDNPVWELPNVKANHPEKTIHPCQFPHELVERCVLAFTNMGDVVLDPFLGTGTSAIAAIKAGRRAIGIDKEAAYIAIAEERLADLRRGELKLRPSGRQVRIPKTGEAVATVPKEWVKD
jgi:adenine-specific DNA-methyltransferase